MTCVAGIQVGEQPLAGVSEAGVSGASPARKIAAPGPSVRRGATLLDVHNSFNRWGLPLSTNR